MNLFKKSKINIDMTSSETILSDMSGRKSLPEELRKELWIRYNKVLENFQKVGGILQIEHNSLEEFLEDINKQLGLTTSLYIELRTYLKDSIVKFLLKGFNCFIKRLNKEKKTDISEDRYKQLLEKEQLLQALKRAGVDNWEGYDFALDIFTENLT